VDLPFFEIARVLVRLDHVASGILNANHSIVRAPKKLLARKSCAQWEGSIIRLPGIPLAIPGHRSIGLTQTILSFAAKARAQLGNPSAQ